MKSQRKHFGQRCACKRACYGLDSFLARDPFWWPPEKTFRRKEAGTYLNSFTVNDDTATGFVQYAGSTALASSLSSVAGMPKLRFLFQGNWTYGALSTTYLLYSTGSHHDPTIPGAVQVDRYLTHDVQLNLDFGKLIAEKSWLSSLKLTRGVNDLTYAKVPIFYAGPLGSGFSANGYDTSNVDPVSRFIYASAHVLFARH